MALTDLTIDDLVTFKEALRSHREDRRIPSPASGSTVGAGVEDVLMLIDEAEHEYQADLCAELLRGREFQDVLNEFNFEEDREYIIADAYEFMLEPIGQECTNTGSGIGTVFDRTQAVARAKMQEFIQTKLLPRVKEGESSERAHSAVGKPRWPGCPPPANTGPEKSPSIER